MGSMGSAAAGSCEHLWPASFESTFQGLFSEINLGSDKLGKTYSRGYSLIVSEV